MSNGKLKLNLTVQDLIIIADTLYCAKHVSIGYTAESKVKIHEKIEKAFKRCDVKLIREKKGNDDT